MSGFGPWLEQQLAQVRDADEQATPEVRLQGIAQSWLTLNDVQGRLHKRHERMIFGAIIADQHIAGLVQRVGPQVDARVEKLQRQALAQVLAWCGFQDASPPPAPRGFFTRLVEVVLPRPAPHPTGPANTANASAALRRGPWQLYAPLLDHPSPVVRKLLVDEVEAGARELIERAAKEERDLEVRRAAVQRLGAIRHAASRPVLQELMGSVGSGHPLRPDVVIANFCLSDGTGANPAEQLDLTDPGDRLALLAAVSRGLGPRPLWAQLVRVALRDERATVVQAALGAAVHAGLTNCILEIALVAANGDEQRRAAAIPALGALGAREPSQAIQPLLALAIAGAPGAADALLVVLAQARLETTWLAWLVQARPLLSDARLVERIHQLEARAKPEVEPVATGDGDLERELEQHPFDTARWLVFADQLQSTGDVRGELIARAHAGAPILDLVEANAAATVGPLAELLGPSLGETLGRFEWHMGFARAATLKLPQGNGDGPTMAQLVAATLRSPLCRFLTTLRVGMTSQTPDENDYAEVLEVLARAPRARQLRSLTLGEFTWPDESELSWVRWGDVSSLWTSMPGLAELHLRGGGGSLGEVRSTSLRSLRVETTFLGAEQWAEVCNAQLPGLTSLELWLGPEQYDQEDITDDQLGALLGREDLPLKDLGIVNSTMGREVLEALRGTKLLAGLERLTLAKGTLGDEDARYLVEHAQDFAHLKRLDLSENVLDAQVDALVKALPMAVTNDQRPDEGEGERYVAVME